MRKVILASTSPRRSFLLKKYRLLKRAVAPQYDDSIGNIKENNDIKKETYEKLNSIKNQYEDDIIVACDTVVKLGKEFLGKPKSKSEAKEMLVKLSNREHYVISYILLYDGKTKKYLGKFVKTKVLFGNIFKNDLKKYLDNADYMDKAGAYAIQDEAALFIKKIEGDYLNIVGFPLFTFYELLRKLEEI
ncbi:septum formation protein Maf [bacterium]|nr:septum formation protein Maf [bacterium]